MRIFKYFILLLPFFSLAQIGVNTTTPNAALDIESTDNGLLIPRVQLANALDIATVINPAGGALPTSTLIYNIAASGVAPNNVGSGFYYWNGTRWIPLANTTIDHDWYEEGTTTAPDAIADNMFHMGKVAIGKNTANTTLDIETINENTGIKNRIEYTVGATSVYAIDNDIEGMNSQTKFGLRNYFKSSPGTKVGVYNVTDAPIFGNKTGVLNSFFGYMGDAITGAENQLQCVDYSSGTGVYNNLSVPSGSGGTGRLYGVQNVISGNSTSPAYGIHNTITAVDNVNGGSYGMFNTISGTKIGGKYGMRNVISSSVADNMNGISNTITSSVNGGSIIGIENTINANSNTPTSGNYNQLGGTGSSNVTGIYSSITNSGDGTHTGIHSILNGSGIGEKRGTYTYIDPAAGGTHYGILTEVLKAGNNFAARFIGKVTIGTASSIGVDNYVFPMARGTNGQIMQTDGTGNLTWQNPNVFSWSLTGNSVNAATQFLGSTNNADVIFKRNNANAGFIGAFNTAFGINTLPATSGVYNTAVGVNALSGLAAADQNCAFGWNALSNVTTGGNNIGIGTGAQVPTATANNQIRLGNVNIVYAGIQVAWSVTSDRRWKNDIKNSDLGLDFINRLHPVSYVRKNDTFKKTEYGFIAQELEKTLTEFGATNNGIITKDDAGMLSVRYNDLLAPIVKAIQELKTENDTLKAHNEALNNRLKTLENKLITFKNN